MKRRIFLAGAVAAVAGVANAQNLGVTGTYKVDGRNPDGSRYRGTVRIVQVGNSAKMTWDINGGQSYKGSGRIDGRPMTIDCYSIGRRFDPNRWRKFSQ
ncbi:MAG: hypothetical protein AAF393_17505 [Pseudomonadota bacterium]